ncbi:hypothetical protein ACFSQJ_10965 [Croceitalea marina]|uniref:Uncharacterized protein n=1 Tax=Croceitalea marina TaxID=1775166 RepID=A0ABW5MZ07_9FLAO
MKAKKLLFVIMLLVSTLCLAQHNSSIVYEADKNGKVLKGNLKKLLEHVQNGRSVRVGWMLPIMNPKTNERTDMWHWTDAGFITVLNGHVFAQIHGIFQQGPGFENPPSVFLASDKPDSWVAILGTTGVMRQKFTQNEKMVEALKNSGFTDEQVKEELKKMEIMKLRTRWVVQ